MKMGQFDAGTLKINQSNFDDVGDFHQKFNLDNTTHKPAGPRPLDAGLLKFRINFLIEELREFVQAIDFQETTDGEITVIVNHEKAFDSLLDLAYVVKGTAHVMGYPWQRGWDEVQRANMAKERCELDHPFIANTGPDDVGCCRPTLNGICGQPHHKHSLRGNINDVIKPPGWKEPNISGVLREVGFHV
jgi:predicted HAD superfamily Cof-like phosphohydrolase